ncbi:MAG: hypothetical protein KDB14_29840 [Planctomycetales bacterium]|nr:hypothetical protein [Planctomycetales bacterium]
MRKQPHWSPWSLGALACWLAAAAAMLGGASRLQAKEPTEAFYLGNWSALTPVAAQSTVALQPADTSRDAIWTPGVESIVFNSATFRANQDEWNDLDGVAVAIRGELGQTVKGSMLVLQGEKKVRMEFSVKLDRTDDRARKAFWSVWRRHYQLLVNRGLPGSAWFRHQLRRANLAIDGRDLVNDRRTRQFFGRSESDTFALMSGGRAISENLQLDREIPIRGVGEGAIDISTIKGITVREFDWSPHIKGVDPQRDPLATLIPDDQHAVFFPSFPALVSLADNADENGTPLLHMAEPRSEDARSRQRYERQLGLSLNSVARVIGPQLVASVALTGGDAYLRTGTDVALLLETTQPATLLKFVQAQQALQLAKNGGAKPVTGQLDDLEYWGVVSPTREVCSYAATLNNAVVVTNSLAQLKRLHETAQKQRPCLAESADYIFFRNRYPREDEAESGLLIISDPTIRRWCGPRWRIAASRRTRVAAAMAEIQSQHLTEMVTGGLQQQVIQSTLGVARGESFQINPQRINSDSYGSLDFHTPIMELDLQMVSSEEAQLFRRWRDGYQRNWSNYFDPIAVRFTVNEQAIAADVTVMPLIDNSRYNQTKELSNGSKLTEAVGDPHSTAMLQWSLALNPDSPRLKGYTNILSAMAPQIRVDPLSWVGNGFSLYVDKDEFWKRAMAAEKPDDFLEENAFDLPIAAHVEVRNALKLTLFMTGLRAFIEQTVPGVTVWEAKTHHDESYVKISATERAGREAEKFSLFYAASGEGLTLTLNEQLMQRALDRRLARRKAAQGDDAEKQKLSADNIEFRWPDQQVAMRVSPEGVAVFEEMFGRGYRDTLQRMSFDNLEVLNEWKRLFPELDPLKVQQDFWTTRLYCPGGGEYVWNDELKTMESTSYGSRLNPKSNGLSFPVALKRIKSGEFGLTFEENGLRARMHLERK